MSEIRELLARSRAASCVECGKCSAACSMAAMYADITLRCSPRGLVQQALRLGRAEREDDLWRCLQCGNCTTACPEGVDPALLIRLLRDAAGEEHAEEDRADARRVCASCGREILPVPAAAWLKSALPLSRKETKEDLRPEDCGPDGYLALCGVCRGAWYAVNNTR